MIFKNHCRNFFINLKIEFNYFYNKQFKGPHKMKFTCFIKKIAF